MKNIKKTTIIILIFFSVSTLSAQLQESFNFVYYNGTTQESVSGYRHSNGDQTDSIELFFSSPVTYRLLIETSGTLTVPTEITHEQTAYLEITTNGSTYIVGSIDPMIRTQLLEHTYFQTGHQIAGILAFFFMMCWYARNA